MDLRTNDWAAPAQLGSLRTGAFAIGGVFTVASVIGLFMDKGQFFDSYITAWIYVLAFPVGMLGLMLITAAFSHIELWPIAVNMFVLWSFGSLLERMWGTKTFVVFYLVAAVVASASHCFVSTIVVGDPSIPALGASGAVSGLLLAFALLFPEHRILVFGIVPMPALVAALAFVAIDVWGLVAQSRGGGLPIGHGAHLGGALCGLLFWASYLRTRFRRRPAACSAHG